MEKGIDTKLTILDTALLLVRKIGFESVSIGHLAKEVGMSKSGLFAHFKSKEAMHVMILDHAAQTFTREVFRPALKLPRGLPRLRGIFDNWMKWSGAVPEGGCPFLTASVEFDDRPGPVQDSIKYHLDMLVGSINKSCRLAVENGDLKKDTDCEQLTFELYSLILGFHLYKKTLGHSGARKMTEKSLDNLFEQNKA